MIANSANAVRDLIDAEQPPGFVTALGVAEKLEGDLLALRRFFQNNFEPAEFVTVQTVLDVLSRLFDERFFKRMRVESQIDFYHAAEV